MPIRAKRYRTVMMSKELKYASLWPSTIITHVSVLAAIGHICGRITDTGIWTEIIVYYIIFQLLLFWRHEHKKQNH